MNKPDEHGVAEAVDLVQERLTSYACRLKYDTIPPDAVHAAKTRIIDTLGALIGGFFEEPSRIARNVAAEMPCAAGATIIGTRMRTTPDVAAFVNGTAARSVEANDVAHKSGGRSGHPSDVVMPVLAAAEKSQVSGREFITAVILAYEVYLRFAEAISTPAFDSTNFACLGSAVAAGTMFMLPPHQLAQCISLAAVPNNALNQTRAGQFSMWKAMASGQAGRAGVFAAMLAGKGVEGPHHPFDGKYGWCDHIAQKRLSLDVMGGNGTPFRLLDTIIKPRAACYHTLSPILAAEKAAASFKGRINDIKSVTIETYTAKSRSSGRSTGADNERWRNPQSRETADHSIHYTVAAALMDGTVTPQSFNAAHLWNPELRALLQKIEVIDNDEFTAAYEQHPMQHRTRVTVTANNGDQAVGESGGEHGDLSDSWNDTAIADKFRRLTEDYLGARKVTAILDRLWNLERLNDVAEIAPALVLD